METIKIKVSGLVQGVGFRYCTEKLANSLDIKGIVMNRSDGTVYIEAQGDPMNLEQFISGVRRSPSPSGRVDDIKIEKFEHEPYSDFSVTYE